MCPTFDSEKEKLGTLEPSEDGKPEKLTPLKPRKPFLRRRPAGTKPAPRIEEPPRWDYYEPEPRPATTHDRYLTYDMNGKLRTHTYWRSPDFKTPSVKRTDGKKKPKPSPSNEAGGESSSDK